MPEPTPGSRPGHLDIDAVSAFIDRDLDPDDLATIAFHLAECPPCKREVIEIRTTVVLLSNLPQYAPRRSFCLGHEHARALRRRRRGVADRAWVGSSGPASGRGSAVPPLGGGRYGAWLSGMQAAAVLVGALLIMMTAGDLAGIPLVRQAQFAAPTAAAGLSEAPQAARPAPTATGAAGVAALAPAASAPEPSFRMAAAPSAQGTGRSAGASEGVLTEDELAAVAPDEGTFAAAKAMPTSAPVIAPDAAPVGERVTSETRLPWPRLAQLALALILAWLIVSIVGLRRVRR